MSKTVLTWIMLGIGTLIECGAYAVPLETHSSFMTDHPDNGRKGQWVQWMARGTGTDDMYVVEVDPTTGKLPVDAAFSLTNDTDYGTVGANTLRTAAQLGNATGGLDYSFGGSGAQTLRTAAVLGNTAGLASFDTGAANTQTLRVVTSTDSKIKITDGTDDLAVNADGSINTVATATNLDIRDLSDLSDSVAIGDGVETANVNVSNELQVRDDDANTDLDTLAGTVAGTEQQVDIVASIPAGVNNIGDVDIASSIPAGTNNIGDVDIASAIPAGSNTIGGITNLPATVDTASGADGASTLRAVLATRHEAAATPIAVQISNGTSFTVPAVKGRSYSDSIRNDYSSTSVTTAAWVQLIASTAGDINSLMIFDSCGQTLELGIGAAASETRVLIIPPGGIDGQIPLYIASGTRVAIKAISADCTSGEINITGLN